MDTVGVRLAIRVPVGLLLNVEDGSETKIIRALLDAELGRYGIEIASCWFVASSLSRLREIKKDMYEDEGDV